MKANGLDLYIDPLINNEKNFFEINDFKEEFRLKENRLKYRFLYSKNGISKLYYESINFFGFLNYKKILSSGVNYLKSEIRKVSKKSRSFEERIKTLSKDINKIKTSEQIYQVRQKNVKKYLKKETNSSSKALLQKNLIKTNEKLNLYSELNSDLTAKLNETSKQYFSLISNKTFLDTYLYKLESQLLFYQHK